VRSRFDPLQGQRIFPVSSVSRPALEPTQPLLQWVPGVHSPGLKHGRGVTLTTHPHPVPMSRMSRSYTSSPPKLLHGVLWDSFHSLLCDYHCRYFINYENYKIRFRTILFPLLLWVICCKGLCTSVPLYTYLLQRNTVSFKSAEAWARNDRYNYTSLNVLGDGIMLLFPSF
jgi:hypothetical protein